MKITFFKPLVMSVPLLSALSNSARAFVPEFALPASRAPGGGGGGGKGAP